MYKMKKRLNKKRFLMLLLTIVSVLSFFGMNNTYATIKTFGITNVTLESKSDSVEGDISSFNNEEIKSTITYHKLGDYAIFRVTIKNNDNIDHEIESITNDNSNPYIEYTHDDYKGTIIKSNESFDFIVKAVYKNEVMDATSRNQDYDVKFNINLVGDDSSSIIINPNTGDNMNINFFLFIVSTSVLAICFIKKVYKYKKASKVFKVLVLGLILIPVMASASVIFNITFDSKYNLYDKMAVSYDINGKTTTVLVPYGEKIELEAPIKEGYVFKEWKLEDGTDLDTDLIMTEDLKLVPVFEKIEADITINIDDENIDSAYKKVTIENTLVNIDSDKVFNEYSLDNGSTWNTYTKELYIEENITINVRTKIIDTNTVIGENSKEINNISSGISNLKTANDVYDIQYYNIGEYEGQIDEITLIKCASIEEYEAKKDSLTDDYIVSLSNSDYPTYMWIVTEDEETVLYYFSEAKTIYLNKNSSFFYSYFTNLKEIDFTKIDTSKVTDMSYMFAEDNSLEALDLSSFNTSNVKDMSYMFENSNNIKELDLSSFDTNKVLSFNNMFNRMDSLTTIYTSSDWSSKDSHMFIGTPNLVGGSGTKFAASRQSGTYARIDDPDNNRKGYFTGKNVKERLTITLNGNGVELENNKAIVYKGNKIGYLDDPIRENYKFEGWFTGITDGIKITEDYVPEGNITIYARWTELEKYNITFDYGDGRTDSKIVYIDSKIGELDNPTRDKFVFDGWYTKLPDGTKVTENFIPNESMTIYAKWKEIFDITLDGNGIELEDSLINVLEGNTIGTLPELSRREYFFDGWYTKLSDGEKVDENYVPNSDMTIYAIWDLKDIYTITFDYGDGRTETKSVYEKDSLEELPTKPKEDSVILGWYKESTYENEVTSSLVPTSDATYYAKWSNMVSDNNDSIVTLSSDTCPNNNITVGSGIVCKRALNLHQEICSSDQGCRVYNQYENGETITYGNCGVEGTLTNGDAFTCDVNGDGKFNEETERFYYVSDYFNTTTKQFEDDTAVLIYYNNVGSGLSSNTTETIYASNSDIEALGYTCNESRGCSWYGPITAIKELPTNLEWPNVSLKNNKRQILSSYAEGGNTTHNSPGGLLPSNFSYEGYAARILDVNEIVYGCGLGTGFDLMGFYYLKDYNFLFENTRYSNGAGYSSGWKLENPSIYLKTNTWVVSYFGSIMFTNITQQGLFGTRPAIEVPKTKISY